MRCTERNSKWFTLLNSSIRLIYHGLIRRSIDHGYGHVDYQLKKTVGRDKMKSAGATFNVTPKPGFSANVARTSGKHENIEYQETKVKVIYIGPISTTRIRSFAQLMT